MNSIVHTEAIVLRAIKYRETSKIVTFYTREFGKLKAVAKGARQMKSKFGSSLEPMSRVSVVLYKKDHRDLQLVSQCDLVLSMRYLYDDLDKMAVGMFIIELMDKVSHDEEKNYNLFHLLQETFTALNAVTKNPKNLLYGFVIGLSRMLGFRPEFQHCVVCRKPVQKNGTSIVFHVGKGGPLCPSHVHAEGLKVNVSASSLDILPRLSAEHDLRAVVDVDIEKNQRAEIESLLLGYLRYHVEGLQHLKSVRVMQRILA